MYVYLLYIFGLITCMSRDVSVCFQVSVSECFPPAGLSAGSRWRRQWTGCVGPTGSIRAPAAGWSSAGAGSLPPASCWASNASPRSHRSSAWSCRRPQRRWPSTEEMMQHFLKVIYQFVFCFAFLSALVCVYVQRGEDNQKLHDKIFKYFIILKHERKEEKDLCFIHLNDTNG